MTREEQNVLYILTNKVYKIVGCKAPITNWTGSYPETEILRVSKKQWTGKQMIRIWRLMQHYKKKGLLKQGQSYFISPYNDIGLALRQTDLIRD